jgi:hypothetical protein
MTETKFLIVDRENPDHEIVKWVTLAEILEEINRDRSEEWTDYNTSDYEEGLKEWTAWTIIKEKA